MGLGGIRTEKKYGGLGLSYLDMCSVLYEIGKADVSMYTFIGGHNGLGQAMIIELAGEEQKKRLLPEATLFKKICCFALTEPKYGSDASSL